MILNSLGTITVGNEVLFPKARSSYFSSLTLRQYAAFIFIKTKIYLLK